jgi:hypothetical protein
VAFQSHGSSPGQIDPDTRDYNPYATPWGQRPIWGHPVGGHRARATCALHYGAGEVLSKDKQSRCPFALVLSSSVTALDGQCIHELEAHRDSNR